MPMRVDHLIKNRRTLVMGGGGETLTITYAPAAISPALLSAISAAEAADNDVDKIPLICEALAQIIIEWDLIDQEGNPIALTKVAISQLPIGAVLAIWQALIEDTQPDPTKLALSAAGSVLGDS